MARPTPRPRASSVVCIDLISECPSSRRRNAPIPSKRSSLRAEKNRTASEVSSAASKTWTFSGSDHSRAKSRWACRSRTTSGRLGSSGLMSKSNSGTYGGLPDRTKSGADRPRSQSIRKRLRHPKVFIPFGGVHLPGHGAHHRPARVSTQLLDMVPDPSPVEAVPDRSQSPGGWLLIFALSKYVGLESSARSVPHGSVPDGDPRRVPPGSRPPNGSRSPRRGRRGLQDRS